MERWTDDRIWEAVAAWRWIPPGAKRLVHQSFELAVTPGAYALTYAYGLHAKDGPSADAALTELRRQVEALGGTGVRVHWDPHLSPSDLPERLERRGYTVIEQAEALAWELVGAHGEPRFPDFRLVEGVEVREALNDHDYDGFLSLSSPIFGDPAPPERARIAFKEEFERSIRACGHSDRFVAWDGDRPIGRAGLEIVGEVARLWGTGTLPQERKRGVYGALVRARCEEGARRGATLALTTARVGTSGPILKHHGFRVLGPVRLYEVRW